jgi:poly-gamma-glutamate synthesis protein (capsule biosynthesis protein)
MLGTPSASEREECGGVRGRGRSAAALSLAALMLAAAGCGTGSDDAADESRESSATPSSEATPSGETAGGEVATPSGTPETSAPPDPRPVTIAFAGDLHFEGSLEARLADPGSAVGPLGNRLERADLAIVNLEAAVTDRGSPEPKQYTFQDPPEVFDALKASGVDVVTMANNHGLDYGPPSIPDALRAARAAGMPVIGIGRDAARAYRPWIVTVKGQRIAFFGATAVVDSILVDSWSAGANQAGLATALDGNNAALVDAIRAVRPRVDTVVVDMHYGADLTPCPTEIQREVARDAVRAGADIVVGQHAHILLGGGYLGSAYVHYGLGNFQFYSASGATAETGVLKLTASGRDITEPRWFPGVISSGVPLPLKGAAAAEAVDRWEQLRACTGLTASPTR